MKYLVGIDNGGTFSKAAVFDEDGKMCIRDRNSPRWAGGSVSVLSDAAYCPGCAK